MSGFGCTTLTTYAMPPSTGTSSINMQMSACGALQAILTAVPDMTYWRFRHVQYSNFAMQSVCIPPSGTAPAFGDTSEFYGPKHGELLYFTYLLVQLPGLMACPPRAGGCGPTQQFPWAVDPNSPCSAADYEFFLTQPDGAQGWLYNQYGSCGTYATGCGQNSCGQAGDLCDADPWACWANAIGQLIPKKALLFLGPAVADSLYSDFLFQWEELAGKPGKRLTEMVGKAFCREQLIVDSSEVRLLYVPLPFFYTLAPGMALPAVSSTFSCVKYQITFVPLQCAVIVSGPNVVVNKCGCGGGLLQPSDLRCNVDVTAIYLDMVERDAYMGQGFDQLITQTSAIYTSLTNTPTGSVSLSFLNPVVELIWAVRRKCAEANNAWFNYSGILGREPLQAAELMFDSTARAPMRAASWYRLVQPYQYHTCIPEGFIYVYSFALYPEEPQPSGVCNFSRLANVKLNYILQDGLAQGGVTFMCFGRSLNLIKYRAQTATIVFASSVGNAIM